MSKPRTFRAPGRVNLIGGQVDYHEGWVVSLAIDRDVCVHRDARAPTVGSSPGRPTSTARSTSRPTATTIRRRHAPAMGPGGRRCRPGSRRPRSCLRSAPTSTITSTRSGRRGPVVERGLRGRVRARLWPTRPDFALDGIEPRARRATRRTRCDRRAVRHPGPDGFGARPRRSRRFPRLPHPRGRARRHAAGPRGVRRAFRRRPHAGSVRRMRNAAPRARPSPPSSA